MKFKAKNRTHSGISQFADRLSGCPVDQNPLRNSSCENTNRRGFDRSKSVHEKWTSGRMKREKPVFQKTEHFLYRQWDRGISDHVIHSITSQIETLTKNKCIVLVGFKYLRQLGEKVPTNHTLVLVVKNRVLITLYYVKDLFSYLKTASKKTKIINL